MGDRYGDWLFLSDGWERELGGLLPVRIDLDIGDTDIAKDVIAPALAREGLRIYPSERPQPANEG